MARGRKATTATTEAVEEKVAVETKAEEKKVDTKDAEIEALKAQIAEMQKMIKQAQEAKTVPIVQVAAPKNERVHFLFEAEVADDNIFAIGEQGEYGKITGKTGSFYIPKTDLSRVMTGSFRAMMDNRWIIVVSGMTDEEREAYGVNYREGEYLDKKAFAKMVDLGEEMLEIYPKLCAGHKEMVAKRYYEAYAAGNPKVTRELVVKLNKLSKEAGSAKGDFIGIIEQMNATDAE